MSTPQIDSLLGAAFATTFATPPQLDAEAVGTVVTRYALAQGCSDSNATAATSWGIRNGSDTLSAIRHGKHRADQLALRELSAQLRALKQT